MAPAASRNSAGVSGGQWLALAALGLLFATVLTLWATVHLAFVITGEGSRPAGNPFDVPFRLFSGEQAWTSTTTTILAAIGLVVVLFAALITLSIVRSRRRSSRVDGQSRHMGRGKDVKHLSVKHAQATAKRLQVQTEAPGVPIGRLVSTGAALVGTWEDMHLDVWGPRTGKTTSRAIPAILAAPGPVLVTSNKRDVVDATRGPREGAGQTWVFDPQGVAGEAPQWFWDPLSYVTDETKAAELAQHFAAGSRDPGSRSDAYFDPAGQDLLAGLLLAAALDYRPITDVYSQWLTRPNDDTPVDVLQSHDYGLIASQVASVIAAPEKQRGGIYGTAQQMASCLTNRSVAEWITPQSAADARPRFNPDEFVRSGATLYSLSKEGRGTAGPLVTALTVAVVEAAEELAAKSRGGRLSVPLVGVLDEAANVCRWKELPNLYSHYGSRGIVLMTVLQSWSQGVEVWGEHGMRKLWSASNIKVYGGGVDEDEFLEHLSKVIGDYERTTESFSSGRGGRTVSSQRQRERILTVADLAALPKGRAIVIGSGSVPTMVRTQPWMIGPHADEVRRSIQRFDPQPQRTLTEAAGELSAVARVEREGTSV